MMMAFRFSSKIRLEVSLSPIFPPAIIETLCAVMLVAEAAGLISEMLPLALRKTFPVPASMVPIRTSAPLKTPRLALLVVNEDVAPMVIEPWDCRTIEPGEEVRIRSSRTSASLLDRVIFPEPLWMFALALIVPLLFVFRSMLVALFPTIRESTAREPASVSSARCPLARNPRRLLFRSVTRMALVEWICSEP